VKTILFGFLGVRDLSSITFLHPQKIKVKGTCGLLGILIEELNELETKNKITEEVRGMASRKG